MPYFKGSVLFLQSYSSIPEVGTTECVRWHDRHAKLRKAEAWNSFQGLEEAANQCFMAVTSTEIYYKPRTSTFNSSFPQSIPTAYSEWLFMVGTNSSLSYFIINFKLFPSVLNAFEVS